MTELLTLQVHKQHSVWIHWQFQLEPHDDPEFLPLLNLLNLVWEVSNSLKKRDIEFEAPQFLKSQKTRTPKLRDPRIISLAQEFSSIVKEQQPLTSKHLGPKVMN